MKSNIEKNGPDNEWREGIKTMLKQKNAVIEFTKANGQHRVMRCTLREDILPPFTEFGEVKTPTANDTLAVWDLELNSWRSFRFDTVTSVEFEA
jgi:hypothetical protein